MSALAIHGHPLSRHSLTHVPGARKPYLHLSIYGGAIPASDVGTPRASTRAMVASTAERAPYGGGDTQLTVHVRSPAGGLMTLLLPPLATGADLLRAAATKDNIHQDHCWLSMNGRPAPPLARVRDLCRDGSWDFTLHARLQGGMEDPVQGSGAATDQGAAEAGAQRAGNNVDPAQQDIPRPARRRLTWTTTAAHDGGEGGRAPVASPCRSPITQWASPPPAAMASDPACR